MKPWSKIVLVLLRTCRNIGRLHILDHSLQTRPVFENFLAFANHRESFCIVLPFKNREGTRQNEKAEKSKMVMISIRGNRKTLSAGNM